MQDETINGANMSKELEEMYEVIGEIFPSCMGLVKQLDLSEQAVAYKSIAVQVEKTLDLGWDDLPTCKSLLESMRDQLKQEQYRLAQKI